MGGGTINTFENKNIEQKQLREWFDQSDLVEIQVN